RFAVSGEPTHGSGRGGGAPAGQISRCKTCVERVTSQWSHRLRRPALMKTEGRSHPLTRWNSNAMASREKAMNAWRFALAAGMFLAAALPAPLGWAQSSTSDKVAAEGLFDQGRAAMQRGDFAQACGLLERSQRIDPAVGTLLYLAECYEKSGRTASAWA